MFPIQAFSPAFLIALVYLIHSVSSQGTGAASADCNSRNGGVYIPLNKPCRVTFFLFKGENKTAAAEASERGVCGHVIDNEDFAELTTEDAHVWPDMCLDDHPLRCYTVEEYRDLLSLMGKDVLNSDDEDNDFAVPQGTSHMMVNCTADGDGGISLSSETLGLMALSAGAIAAIVIGVLVCICLSVGILCCCCC